MKLLPVEITITLIPRSTTPVVLWPWHMEAQAVLIGYRYWKGK